MDKFSYTELSKMLTNAYDFQGYTNDEIFSKIAQKINIIIEHFNYIDNKVENEKENNKIKFDYLLGTGLPNEVAKIFLEKIADGSLSSLINEVLLSNINNKVDTFAIDFSNQLYTKANKNDIAKISNGTPLFVNSINEMNDKSRIYVNLTDGYVYIPDNNSFVKTDIKYQSRGISDNSIEPSMLKDGVSFLNIYNYDVHCIENKYIDLKGLIVSASNTAFAKIPVKEGQTYSFWRASGNYHTGKGYTLLMNNDYILEKIDASLYYGGIYKDIPFVTIEIPQGVNYLCFNLKLNDYDNRHSCIVCQGSNVVLGDGVNKIFGKDITDIALRNYFDEFINSIKVANKNLYDYDKHYYADKYINLSGDISGAKGWGFAKIPVESEHTYSIYMPNGMYANDIGALCFHDETKKISYHLPASDFINGQYNGIDYITFKTPINCKYILITCKRNTEIRPFDNSTNLICIEGTIINNDTTKQYLSEIFGYKIKDIVSVEHSLKGIKWGFIGDSLTEKNHRALKNYIDYIVEETGIIAVNLGVSGTGYKKTEEKGSAFYQRINKIDTDFDILTIFGSGNDLSLTLGNINDTNTSTVFGCVNETIKKIYEKMPTVKLGIISPTPWVQYPNHTDGNKMQLLSEGLEKICKKNSIPFLDLYNCSNLRPWDSIFRNLMYSRDDGNGVHPDENGHSQFFRKILKFGESL